MRRIRWSLPLLLLAPAYFYAQDIKGTVLNSDNGESVSGATVVLQPGNKTIRTGLDGSFKFNDVGSGRFSLMVEHPYFKKYTDDVQVGREDVKLSINLADRRSQDISEVVITGIRRQNTENMARRLEQKSPQVLNVVSGNAIQISPDLTVANVIQRVSGVSVERSSNGEGQHAILRGMDKRYNYTLVNGVKIPSPDNRYRYVPLDIFPSELLDRLEVYKSLLPNMEGDAVGGAINMVMKNAADKRDINANLAVGYNQFLFDNKFKTFDTSGISFKSPYDLRGKNYKATIADFPNSIYKNVSLTAMPNFTGGITMGRRYFSNKFGALAAVSYQNNNRLTESEYFNSSNVDVMKYVVISSAANRRYYENQQRLGVHTVLDYTFNKNNKLQFYNAYMQLREAQLRESVTANAAYGNYDPANGNAAISFDNRARLTQQRIWNSTLKGEHKIIPGKFSMDWTAVASSADNQTPDVANYGTLGTRVHNVDTNTTPTNAARQWLRNSDTDYAGYINFKYEIIDDLDLQLGGMYRDKQRSNYYNSYSLYPVSRAHVWGIDFTGYDGIRYDVENPQGAVGNSLTHKAGEKIGAGYAMISAELGELEMTGGVRMEYTDQFYNLLFPQNEKYPELHQKYKDWLPSISLKYELDDNQNLHATYFRSINRPGFFELVPAVSPITEENYRQTGNPMLKHAVADNIDLRYELFPRPSDQVLVGVFYKKIKNPIEFTLQPDAVRGQDIYAMPGNFGNATNYGAELDIIKFFNNFGFKANYTYTNSSITTPKTVRIRNAQGNLEPRLENQKRPLYGQSEHIANLSLLYKNHHSGWDAQIAGSYTGPRINTVSQFLDNDIWQKGFIQMDASLEKKIRNNISIFLKANNILNTPAELFIKGVNDKNKDIAGQDFASGETLIRKDYYKQNYLLGVRVKL